MSEFLIALLIATKKALPVLFVVFVVVFFVIILARVILFFLIEHAYKKLLKKIKDQKLFYAKKQNYLKEDEELIRKKMAEIPRAHSEVKAEMKSRNGDEASGSYDVIASKEKERDKKEMNEINIVDIVKPVGFWTSMILGQKLTYLINSAQIINKRGDQGFWASMIEAKERAAGKQHSRGR
jgi:hypothetical protein